MRIFVKHTDNYKTQATQHNCFIAFSRFQKRATSKPGFTHEKRNQYDSFPGNYIKEPAGNFRHIYTYKNFTINGEEVRCYLWLCVLPRGGHDYDKFNNFRTNARDRDGISGLNKVDWELYKREIEQELMELPDSPLPPPLEDNEKAFIQRDSGITQDIFKDPIYESKQWIDKVRGENFGDPFKVAEAIEKELYCIDTPGRYDIAYGDNNEKILCLYLQKENINGWFLLGLGSSEQINEIAQKLDVQDKLPTFDELAKKCRRAYPLTMLEDDKDFWWEMERDKDSNFILSNEEISVVSGRLTFPLFLSGRAGSGKSTLLQYLFAEYFLRFLDHDGVPAPVYLSYSDNLITNAKKLATTLFSKNHAYLQKLKDINKNFKDDIEGKFDKSFFVFQKLVRKCIEEHNPSVLDARFASENYISFSRFRMLWEEKFSKVRGARNEYGPALSWHVIRTYIKGWDSEAYLEPEDYNKIGKANKSVSDERFQKVYDVVWDKWYKKLQDDERLWDDQDLVRYCLTPDDSDEDSFVSTKFSAVFCDESQDFTRTETEFILRLSVFSNRIIFDENTLYQLPFVFAGDEFQTLNPTGFSWDSLRSYFTTRLIHETGLNTRVGAPEPTVLTRNYRSTAPIVRLANRLQLLRQTRCPGDSKKMPQIPYYAEEEGASVYCLSPKNQLVWDKLGQMETVLIIPSADGESPQEFINNSPIKGFIDFYEDGSPKNITIYNPIQAKGLEYPYVAIYGFDDTIVNELHLQELLKWYDSQSPVPDTETKDIELKYFLSNAYVSATRAKSKLFILSEFNEKSFWAFAFSSDKPEYQEQVTHLEQQMLAKLSNQTDWLPQDGTSLLGYVLEGNMNAITGDTIINAGEVAKVTEERGLSLHDSGLLRQAAARYRERSKQKDVERCEAYAYWFEQKYGAAANLFDKSGMYDMAVLSYWYAFGKNKTTQQMQQTLSSLVSLKDKSQRYEIIIADHLKNGLNLNDFKLDLDETIKIFTGVVSDEDKDHAKNTRASWQHTLEGCLNKLPAPTPAEISDVEMIISQSNKIMEFGITLDFHKLALMAFNAGSCEVAIDLWEKHPSPQQPREYYRAKCIVLPYPDNLIYRKETAESNWEQNVVADWRKEKNRHELSDGQKKIIAGALISVGEIDEVKYVMPYLLTNAPNLQESDNIIRTVIRRKMLIPEEAIRALQQVRLVELKNWQNPGEIYESQPLNDFLSVIAKIKEVRSEGFEKKLREAVVENKAYIKDFMAQEFGKYSRMMGYALLYTEIGILMERRGHSLDAQRFYNWAIQQTDDSDVKRDLTIRWIVCRERQAAKSDNPDEYLPEAEAKRKELELGLDIELPEDCHFDKWQYLFKDLLNESAMKKKKQANKAKNNAPVGPKQETNGTLLPLTPSSAIPPLSGEDKPSSLLPGPMGKMLTSVINNVPDLAIKDRKELQPEPKDTSKVDKEAETQTPSLNAIPDLEKANAEEKTSSDASPTSSEVVKPDKWFEHRLCDGYLFKYNPAKATLTINWEPDQLRVKIKQGKFPSDGEFVVENDHLFMCDDDGNKTRTPFLYRIINNKIEICIEESGISVSFPF